MSEHCEIDKEKFGAFLARLRKEKGLTQKELAERLFVSDKAVSKWERSLSLPDVALLLPLADCLGVSVTELLRGERTTQPQLPVEEVEALVGSALRMGGEEQAERRTDRRRWRLACVLCVLAGAAETLALRALGFSWAELGPAVLLVEAEPGFRPVAVLLGKGAPARLLQREPHQHLQRRGVPPEPAGGAHQQQQLAPYPAGHAGVAAGGHGALPPALGGAGRPVAGAALRRQAGPGAGILPGPLCPRHARRQAARMIKKLRLLCRRSFFPVK